MKSSPLCSYINTLIKLPLAVILTTVLSACTMPNPVPLGTIHPMIEPLPPEIRPLAQEQDEQIGIGNKQ